MSADTALVAAINQLRRDRNAVILAHYYRTEIQDIADFVGDSLELSRQAANTDADVIVFAACISWRRRQILGQKKRLCCRIWMPVAPWLMTARQTTSPGSFESPDHFVVSYINCTATVKAQSDLICTSSNAVDLVQLPPEQPVLFAPDQTWGAGAATERSRAALWRACIVRTFSEEAVLALSTNIPQ